MSNEEKLKVLKQRLDEVSDAIIDLNDNGVAISLKLMTPTGATWNGNFNAYSKEKSQIKFEITEATESKSLLRGGKW